MTQRVGRRAFLKLSAASLAGWGLNPAWAPAAVPRLVTTLPVPFAHRRIPEPEDLLTRLPADADLLLVPAYIAAGLIQRGRLQPLKGPLGRAHDPEGAFTVPYRYAVSALVHPTEAMPVDPWQAGAAWPSFGRLMLGAALQRRGFSPNDAHAGHLRQVGQDLLRLRPALSANPLAVLRAGRVGAAFALVVVSESNEPELDEGLMATLPPWGGVLVEYDWVLPANAPDPAAARAFLEELDLPVVPVLPQGRRLPPLTTLPERAQVQHAQLWADLAHARHKAGA